MRKTLRLKGKMYIETTPVTKDKDEKNTILTKQELIRKRNLERTTVRTKMNKEKIRATPGGISKYTKMLERI